MSIGRPHKEWILFLCNVEICGGAEKLPRSSGLFVKDFPLLYLWLVFRRGEKQTA